MSPLFGKTTSQFCHHQNFSSEYHIVPGRNEHLEEFYDALCEGQTLNPDKEEGSEGDEEEPIDLRNFTWADGYGPDFLTGASGGQTLGPSGDQNPSTTAFNNLRVRQFMS